LSNRNNTNNYVTCFHTSYGVPYMLGSVLSEFHSQLHAILLMIAVVKMS